ncbi:MAG: DUF748 domain-containing protein [Desulfobacterales bacterium]|jgi:hypothetical protein
MTTKPGLTANLRRILLSKAFIIIVVLLILYTLGGFFLTPYLVRHYVPQIVQDQLQRDAHIGKVRINPFLFTLEANDFELTETDGAPIGAFRRLLVDFELSSLFRWAWTFRQITMDEPLVNLVIETDGVLNLAKLAPKKSDQAEESDSRPPRLLLQDITVSGGAIDIIDRRQSSPATVTFRPLDIRLTDISTLPDRKGPYTLAATTPDGESINWAGEISLHPFRSTGNLVLDNFRAASLWEFVRDSVAIDPPSGTLHFNTNYELDLSGSSPKLALDRVATRLTGLSLRLSGAKVPFFAVKKLGLSATRFDLSTRQLDIGKLSLNGGDINVAVDREGHLNLQRIVQQTTGDGARPQPTVQKSVPKVPNGGEESPWAVKVGAVDISETALTYQDASRTPALDAGLGDITATLGAEVVATAAETKVRLNGITVAAKKMHAGLLGSPEPTVRVDRLALEGGTFDLGQRLLTLSRVGFDGGHVEVVREAGGEINLTQLLAPPQSGAVRRGSEEAAAKGNPWRYAVKTIELSGITTAIYDRTVKADGPLLTLNPLDVLLTDVDGKSPMGFKADIKIDAGGSVTAAGTVDPSGPTVESRIDATGVALTPLQPYIDSVANLEMHSGELSSQGTLQYGMKAVGADLAYDGGLNLAKLRLTESGSKDTLLGWQALKTDQLELRLAPNRLDVKEIKLDRPVGQLIIGEDRTVNLVQVFKTDPPAANSPAGSGPSKATGGKVFPVSIQKLRIDNGILDFADLSLTPQFGTKIHELGGVVAGMSSTADSRAQVQLKGNVDEYGLAKIGGEINVFDPVAFTDIDMTFQNVEMSGLTPYSGKFAGRKIDSGKLSLNLEYKIDNGKLLGDNQIVVDKLKLGRRVESPEAANLPLDLAVALLEDANGVIDIGLPVRGDLNDPKFSFGHLIGKAFVNLITKIATAPFRVLGALVGGAAGENFDDIAFEPGGAAVPAPEREKLKKLAAALQKRPQLKLEVQGRYSTEIDGKKLKGLSVRRAVAGRLGTAPEQDEDPGPLDYGNPDTRRALEAMFAERFGAPALKRLKDSLEKDKGTAAQAAAQPAQAEKVEDPGQLSKAIYTRLVESEPLPATVLTELAEARARAIIAVLTGERAVASERLSTKPPGPLPKDAPVTAKLSLVVSRKSS